MEDEEWTEELIKEEGFKTGSNATISIGVVFSSSVNTCRETYAKLNTLDPMYYLCKKALAKAKRKGGDMIEVVWF